MVDRCLPTSLVKALNKSPEITACHLHDVYGVKPGELVEDVQWIADCGREGWIVVTQNKFMKKVTRELEAIENHRTKVFSLTSADLPQSEQGLVVGRNLLRMIRRDKRDSGCFWRINLAGTRKDIA
jgi:predicted nuclease of predicted toxin-antitoxin system